MENTGSISSSVSRRKSVLATSFATKMEKGSVTLRRSALSVSLFCSRKKQGCSISDAANRNASHKRLAANRRDSTEVGSNVKLKSTMITRMKTTVVVRSSRDRNSVSSSFTSRTAALDSKLTHAPANVKIEGRLAD